MTPDNFAKLVSIFARQKPFRPFTLELVSGGRVEVNHPEALSLYDGGLVACLSTTRVRSFFELGSVIRFISVTGTT